MSFGCQPLLDIDQAFFNAASFLQAVLCPERERNVERTLATPPSDIVNASTSLPSLVLDLIRPISGVKSLNHR